MLSLQQAQTHLDQAKQLTEQGKYPEAMELLEQAAPIFEAAEEWEGYVQCLNVQSYSLYCVGEYDAGVAKAGMALQICLSRHDNEHHDTAGSYQNLAICYMGKGDYNQAIAHCQQALTIFLVTIGEQHLNTADMYNNMGFCYSLKSDDTQAIAYHQQALNIRLAALGEQHPDTASCYHNLGGGYLDKGDYTQAITYLQQALTIRLATIGKKHLETAQSYYNLAQLHHLQTQYPQALHYHQQALQSLALDVPNDDYYPLPKLAGYNSAVYLLETIPAKATTFTALYHQNNTPQDLSAALAHYQCADELIDQMRQSYKTEGSKLTLAEKGKTKVYDAGLAALLTGESVHQVSGFQLAEAQVFELEVFALGLAKRSAKFIPH